MMLLHQHQDGLRRRLHVIGIPSYTIEGFISEICKWEKHSGVEWTIKRLKSLKVDLIRRRSNLQPLTWIRKNRKGDVAGVVGSLFRWSDTNERNFSRCVQAFMAYSFYIFPETSDSQKKKFLEAVQTDKPHNLTDKFRKEFVATVKNCVSVRKIPYRVQPFVTYQGSPGKKAPRLFGQTSVRQDEEILEDLDIFTTMGGRFLYYEFQAVYSQLLHGFKALRSVLDRNASRYFRSLENPEKERLCYLPEGGTIHLLQEPGGKLRSVASPFRLHQEALRPLGKGIYDLIKSLPWDCTHNQYAAHPHIQSHLRQGGEVYCTDLSSATDYFPLDLQLDALRAIFPGHLEWIRLFETLSKGKWSSPYGDLSWTRGQPLGLYPSFGSFSLTHGLLLLHLNDGLFDNQFFVVGDDVVILDKVLNDKYRAMLERMSCPWSPDKSIDSSTLSEFAGKIVTPTAVIPQLKWRAISDDNFLDVCRLLGKKSRSLLSKRQKIVFDKVCNLCEPIGLNFSTSTSTFRSMYEETQAWLNEEERFLASQMGLGKKLTHLSYTSSVFVDRDEFLDTLRTFDEKVAKVLSQTLFSKWSVLNSTYVEGLDLIPAALDQGPRLPLRTLAPTRRSELERYEQMPNMKV